METNRVVRTEVARLANTVERCAVLLLVCVLAALVGMMYHVTTTADKAVEHVTAAQQESKEQMFDVSAFDSWCKGEDQGTIRMVGAWVYSTNVGFTTLEDESGNLWNVEGVSIGEDDFLLLWIVDNHTPEVDDDEVIKIWNEVNE